MITKISSNNIQEKTLQTLYGVGTGGNKGDNVRAERHGYLVESDWTQLEDSPLTSEQKTAWATYRQELRDITQQAGFPWEVQWPVAP